MFFSFKTLTASHPTIITDEKKSIILNKSSWNSGKVFVNIINEMGNTVFSQSLDKKVDLIKYNLNNLETGNYSIKVSDDYRIYSRKFKIAPAGLILAEGDYTAIIPQIKVNRNLIDINMMSKEYNAVVSLMDSDDNVLYVGEILSDKLYRRLNTMHLPTGHYRVAVDVAGKTYMKSFTK